MIWARLVFGGFGRRGLEAVVALIVLTIASALVSSALMVVEGARHAMTRAEREDRPDIVQVKSRFNRAVFETPRSGNLQPLTLPVYEPLIDPEKLNTAGGAVLPRPPVERSIRMAGKVVREILTDSCFARSIENPAGSSGPSKDGRRGL